MTFADFFQRAMAIGDDADGPHPYPYQVELATCDVWPDLLHIPTGAGKTAAIVLAWLYRRRFASDAVRQATPRRLVYCLPMRTLVEQTRAECSRWLSNLVAENQLEDVQIAVHVLMGGEDAEKWDEHPEQDAILIGTQDMLLSRALNRGYGMSRYRWPVHFGLLHNDSQWVLDETQLMGVGVTSSAQLQGLRDSLGRFGCTRTLWMSATLGDEQLDTVDHRKPNDGWSCQSLTDRDRATAAVTRLLTAKKPVSAAVVSLTPDNAKKAYASDLCKEVISTHQLGTLTLVVVNRVDRAQQLFQQLEKAKHPAERFLIHSRFRATDRHEHQTAALDESTIDRNGQGRIIVSTQAIEAGVDLSATTLISELAPWSSCVQRFGRCNRRGNCGQAGNPPARVVWVDLDTSDAKKSKEIALPYEAFELDAAREHLAILADAGPESLQDIEHVEPLAVVHTLRRKDLLELFDTTADIAGNDLDVSRFIRDAGNLDVKVYWREWDSKAHPDGQPPAPNGEDGGVQFPGPQRAELCPVSIGAAKAFVKKMKDGMAWRWNPLDHKWQPLAEPSLIPGMTFLLPLDAGGYDESLGWTGLPKHNKLSAIALSNAATTGGDESLDDDDTRGSGSAVSLEQHLRDVATAADGLREALQNDFPLVPWESIVRAAWWHDVGKAHASFQTALQNSASAGGHSLDTSKLWAKSGASGRLQSGRRGFRHELASVLAWLNAHSDEPQSDLIAFLIASHHGKVRLSIRSLPNETRPTDETLRFARGLWEGDPLPAVEIGNGDVSPDFIIDLELMELGQSPATADRPPQPGWTSRTLGLRDDANLGPFRLAFLEALLRVADWRGSSVRKDA